MIIDLGANYTALFHFSLSPVLFLTPSLTLSLYCGTFIKPVCNLCNVHTVQKKCTVRHTHRYDTDTDTYLLEMKQSGCILNAFFGKVL